MGEVLSCMWNFEKTVEFERIGKRCALQSNSFSPGLPDIVA
jgi:hypothetical protein